MSLMDIINAKRRILFDGAMGTMLFAAGLPAGECPELWNLTQPEKVKKIHKAYFDAGSLVVETNSFGGSALKLAHYGLGKKAAQINQVAAELAKSVAPEGCFVAGSVGPCGLLLEPLGDLSEDALYEAFTEQIMALARGGADVICIETMMDIAEAKVAVKAALDNTSLPVIATMTFNATENGFFTMMGVTPQQASKELVEAGAHVVGANCGNGPEEMIALATQFREHTESPLLFQANAGLPRMEGGNTVYDMGPEQYAAFIPELVKAGADLIGGCCGTTPEHIRKMCVQLQKLPYIT